MINVTVKGVADIGRLMGGGEQKILLHPNANLSNLLQILKQKYGKQFEERVFLEESGNVRVEIRMLLNGRDISFLNGLDTALADGDKFSIIPPLGGG